MKDLRSEKKIHHDENTRPNASKMYKWRKLARVKKKIYHSKGGRPNTLRDMLVKKIEKKIYYNRSIMQNVPTMYFVNFVQV